MGEYIICTDSACDMKGEVLEQWGVPCVSLTFRFDGEEKEYENNEMPVEEFYNRMKNGHVAKTAAVNLQVFSEEFEKHLSQGKDILYLGFSSGLSTTFNSSRLAAKSLMEKYPERKILTVDSLAASAGFGLLLYLTVQEKNKGASIEEARDFAENTKLNICHWFTVDDLVYLKRGGRINPATAFVGNVLGIKPVMHVDNEGHLINVTKVRGRKMSIAALADKLGQTALDPVNGTVFISCADCIEDAKELEKIINSKFGGKVEIITDVGPVIGAHAGPGTLALFFVGKER